MTSSSAWHTTQSKCLPAQCLLLLMIASAGCHTDADCQAFAQAMAGGQVGVIRSAFEDAASLGKQDDVVRCLQAVIEEHPSAATDSVLLALQSLCDRTVINRISAEALVQANRRLLRFAVLAAIYLRAGDARCESARAVPVDKRLVDVLVVELSDTTLIQSARWRGHAGSDQSLSRYHGLARMALYGLLPMTAATAADSMELDLAPSGDPLVAARAFREWWLTIRDDVVWVEQYRAFMPARLFE